MTNFSSKSDENLIITAGYKLFLKTPFLKQHTFCFFNNRQSF